MSPFTLASASPRRAQLLASAGFSFNVHPAELDVFIGNTTPDGGEAQSFTTVAGGFGVSAGYAF